MMMGYFVGLACLILALSGANGNGVVTRSLKMDMGGMNMGGSGSASPPPPASSSSCPAYASTASALQTLCGSSPGSSSPGCTLYRLCTGSVSPPIAPQTCDNTRLLNSICLDQPSLAPCVTYLGTLSGGNSCLVSNSISLYNSSEVTGMVVDMCASMSMSECNQCTSGACPDPLSTYSSLCLDMSTMAECESWDTFCTAEKPGNVAVLCLDTNFPPPCVTDPTQSTCSNYVYPTASSLADMTSLCNSMPSMPGCSVWASCNASLVSNSAYCTPFVLLASTCITMPDMTGCYNYLQMCNTTGSVVKQCTHNLPIPSLPSLDDATSLVLEACSSHFMSACISCTQYSCPDPLTSLSTMCTGMSGMAECTDYYTWCTATSGAFASYCAAGASGDVLPSMLMYFHSRFQETILWRSWIPQSQGQYVGSIFAILGFGVVSVFLKSVKGMLATSMLSGVMRGGANSRVWWMPSTQQLGENVIKSFILGVSLTFDYFNMLVAMTYNVGLFVAVVCGYVLGTALFGHLMDNYAAHLAAQQRSAAADETMQLKLGGAAVDHDKEGAIIQAMVQEQNASCCGMHSA